MNAVQTPTPGSSEREPPTIAARFAILSFASGLVFCCPGTSLLAVVAGATALLMGLREANASWRKFAVGGVLLGLVSLVVLIVLYFVVNEKWEREWRVLYTGPNNALVALDGGSLEGFRAEFTGPAAHGSDADVRAFEGKLREQLGRFGWCRSIRQSPPDLDGSGPWELGEYEATFSSAEDPPWSGTLAARIGIDRLPSGTLRLTWVLIEGKGAHGEDVRIRYPPLPFAEAPGG